MNERIRELLVEAREQTKEGKWNAPTAVWAEKFAEMIVMECADICFSEADGHSMAFGDHCGIMIKKHFEVEE